MKALKPLLAIALAVILVWGWILWQDHEEKKALRPFTAHTDLQESATGLGTAPVLDLQMQRTMVTPEKEFRPPVRAASTPLPPSSYEAIPWEYRLPYHQSNVSRGLYVLPANHKVEH
jgi:hypothetical protein